MSRSNTRKTRQMTFAFESQWPIAVLNRQAGTPTRLLEGLRGAFERVTVDGREWAAKPSSRIPRLDPTAPHDVVVRALSAEVEPSRDPRGTSRLQPLVAGRASAR